MARDWLEEHSQERLDAQARIATRNAPPRIKVAIDRTRHRHGLSPLWPELRHAQPRERGRVVLVGACAPGLSSPVTAATDGMHVREIIGTGAFEHSLRCIKARAVTVALEAGHGGELLASTDDGTLDFTECDRTGLMCVARMKLSPGNTSMLAAALAGRMGLSISMVPHRVEIVIHNGRRTRVIREAELRAVAALWDDATHGRACYRAARVYAAMESDGRGVRRAMRRASVDARTAVLKAGWS